MTDTDLQQAIELAKQNGMDGEFEDSIPEEENLEGDDQEENVDVEDDSSDDIPEDDEENSDTEDDSEDESDETEDEDKKLVKVKVGDKEEEISLSELKSSYMRDADYRVKTQRLAEEKAHTENYRRAYEESIAEYKKSIDEANKVLPALVFRESDELTEALKKINVEKLSAEDMVEYTRLRAYRDQLVEKEQGRDAKYRELVEKQRKLEQEAGDRMWAAAQPELKAIIPEYKDDVKREQLNTNLSKYLVDIYGEDKARNIAQTVRTKEDYLTIYYAYVGKKYLETGSPEKEVAKKGKVIKATNNSGKQEVASNRKSSSKRYEQILNNGRKRGGLSDSEALALLAMKGI